ncbi:hypothetical protein [Streptomyces sp. NPDC057939]|uniref:hypothetical protein n=1 Tax=Streptomyces sp. NPDC057939 TaxID=3346284 RepID=UPI0036EB3D80
MPVPPFRRVISAAAAACLSVLLATPLAQAAGPAPEDGGETLILSNEEYAQRFGHRCARPAGVSGPTDQLAPGDGRLSAREAWRQS